MQVGQRYRELLTSHSSHLHSFHLLEFSADLSAASTRTPVFFATVENAKLSVRVVPAALVSTPGLENASPCSGSGRESAAPAARHAQPHETYYAAPILVHGVPLLWEAVDTLLGLWHAAAACHRPLAYLAGTLTVLACKLIAPSPIAPAKISARLSCTSVTSGTYASHYGPLK